MARLKVSEGVLKKLVQMHPMHAQADPKSPQDQKINTVFEPLLRQKNKAKHQHFTSLEKIYQ